MANDRFGKELAMQVGSAAAGGVVGMGINAIGQAIGNAGSYKQAKRLQQLQIEGQKEMGMFNVERQMDLWNRTNAEAQKEHYKRAGLSPALMYGGSGAGGSTAANTGSVSGQAAGGMPSGGGMNVLMPAQVELMRAQARNLDADTAKKSGVETQLGWTTIEKLKAETSNVKTQETLTKIQATIMEIAQEDITDAYSLTTSKLQQEYFQLKNATDISDATKETMIRTIKQNYVNEVLKAEMTKSGMAVNDASIQKMAADIVQRGQEIEIKSFEAEIRANQPSIGEIGGSMLNSIKTKIDKFLGMDKGYVKPRTIKNR